MRRYDGSTASLRGPRPSPSLAGRSDSRRAIAIWLFACCVLVFAIIVVGGVTRLTRSGLSITEWQPIVGALPPLNETQWQDAFAKYRATPEFRLVNHAMDLAGFKQIFWWEYFHRLLGRLVGLAFLLPLAWFAARRRIPAGFGGPLAAIFVIGGMQGALGWFMVQSGLVDDPRVSQFRLTAHLGLAFVILGAMLWAGLSIVRLRAASANDAAARRVRWFANGVAAMVFLMVLSGGLVAGIRAGFAYNTFPLMNGHVVPPEVLMIEPWWRNFFWNMATVQLGHRVLALLLAIAVPLLWWKLQRSVGVPIRARRGGHLLLVLLGVQIALGIATLVMVVPLYLAAMHQAGAVLVFAASLNVAHALRGPAARTA